jgi:hypothetical protein
VEYLISHDYSYRRKITIGKLQLKIDASAPLEIAHKILPLKIAPRACLKISVEELRTIKKVLLTITI